jgi:5-methylcytosine-specific restriction endonuclease McrA
MRCLDLSRKAKDRIARRARELQWAEHPQKLSRYQVYAQSNGKCHICHELVDLRLEVPNPLSCTIDHVVPLARGGSHTIGNVRIAHMICNTFKSDEPLTIHVRLSARFAYLLAVGGLVNEAWAMHPRRRYSLSEEIDATDGILSDLLSASVRLTDSFNRLHRAMSMGSTC